MSSKHYATQINALMHGDDSVGTFTVPHNIELVTFNKPQFNLHVLHVIKIFEVLKKIPPSKRIRSEILHSDVLDLYNKYNLEHDSVFNQIKTNNIRMTVYKPNSENVPNLIHYIHDTTNLKKIIGFYKTNDAIITYKKSTNEFIPESGFLGYKFNYFIKSLLQGDTSLDFTTKQLIEHFSMTANKYFPGKVIRVFLFSCRGDLEQVEHDEDMAEKFLQNISSKTISPEITAQPLLAEEVLESIVSKRKRNSPKNNSLKLTQKNHKKLHLKSPSPIAQLTLSKTQKGKKSKTQKKYIHTKNSKHKPKHSIK
jgi:hypothetical protein